MSSLTLMDLEAIFEMLDVLMDGPPSKAEAEASRRSAEELARQQEIERQRLERELADMERQAEAEYAAQMHALEQQRVQYADELTMKRNEQAASLNAQMEALRKASRHIAREASAAGSEFLSDYANLVFAKESYAQLARARAQIVRTAANLEREAQIRPGEDVARKADELQQRIDRLRAELNILNEALRETSDEDAGEVHRDAQFRTWLETLEAGAEDVRDAVQIFPAVPEDDAGAHAAQVSAALANIQYYLFGAGGFYLSSAQKQEVARVYGIADMSETFSGLEPFAEADVEARNARFAASHRRALDERIFELRDEVRSAYARYAKMRSALEMTEKAIVPDVHRYADAYELLAALQNEIAGMQRRYAVRKQNEVVRAVVDRAIRTAKRGMAVSRIGEQETGSGNWRALYQLGHDGTTIEVYADARGQVTIEAGAMLEGDEKNPTSAQSAAIKRNNEHFCSSRLPAIIQRINEELTGSEDAALIDVKETQGPDAVHVFRADRYGRQARGLVLRKDGTVAAQGAASAQKQEALHLEDNV